MHIQSAHVGVEGISDQRQSAGACSLCLCLWRSPPPCQFVFRARAMSSDHATIEIQKLLEETRNGVKLPGAVIMGLVNAAVDGGLKPSDVLSWCKEDKKLELLRQQVLVDKQEDKNKVRCA